MTIAGTRRLYAVSAGPWPDIDVWLSRYRRFWTGRLDALDTEVARGRRTPRSPARPTTTTPGTTTPRTATAPTTKETP